MSASDVVPSSLGIRSTRLTQEVKDLQERVKVLEQRVGLVVSPASYGPDMGQVRTRELLAELRMRAENWAGQPGSGYLADWVDDAYQNLTGSARALLDGRRTP